MRGGACRETGACGSDKRHRKLATSTHVTCFHMTSGQDCFVCRTTFPSLTVPMPNRSLQGSISTTTAPTTEHPCPYDTKR